MEQLFNKYQNLIRKQAHKISQKWGMEYEEVEAQGFLIFVEVVKEYDSTKAAFSTFLFHQLKALDYYCLKENKKKQRTSSLQGISNSIGSRMSNLDSVSIERGESIVEYRKVKRLTGDTPWSFVYNKEFEDFCEALERVESIQKNLSEKAQKILEWLLSEEWNTPGDWHLPGLKTAKREFKSWRIKEVESAWEEIKNWWNCYQAV